MNYKKLLSQIFVLTLVVFFLGACGASPEKEQSAEVESADVPSESTVRVGVDAITPPLEYRNDKGELTGFDIELLEMIATKADFEIEWVELTFDEYLEALKQEKVDITLSGSAVPLNIASGIILEEKQMSAALETVDLSDSFLVNEALLFKAIGKRSQDISRIGFQSGRTAYPPDEAADSFEFKDFPTLDAAFSGLAEQQVDAVIAPKFQSDYLLGESSEDFEERNYGYEKYRMAVRKDSNMLSTINSTLQSIIDDGAYADLYTKWFKQDVPYAFLPEDQRNEAVSEQTNVIIELGSNIVEINRSCVLEDYPNCKYDVVQEKLEELKALDVEPPLQELYDACNEFGEESIVFLQDPLDSNNAQKAYVATNNYISIVREVENTFVR